MPTVVGVPGRRTSGFTLVRSAMSVSVGCGLKVFSIFGDAHVMKMFGWRAVGVLAAFAVTATMAPLAHATSAWAAGETPAGGLRDTTTAEFTAGTLASTVVAGIGDGAVTVPTAPNTFSGATLPSGWTVTPWHAGGAVTPGGGVASVEGAIMQSTVTYSKGVTLEFDATFVDEGWQGAGFTAAGTSTSENAMFSIDAGSFWISAGTTRTPISSSYLGAQHHYKITWGTTGFTFAIDNTTVGTLPWTIASGLRAFVSDYHLSGVPLVVDNVQAGSYRLTGSFTSKVLDAGTVTAWGPVDWSARLPGTTTIALTVRTGNTPVPGIGWTSYKTVVAGAPLDMTSRYVQYKATLATSSMFEAPVLEDVTFTPAPSTAITSISDSSVAQFGAGSRGAGILTNDGNGELTAPTTNASTTFPVSSTLPSTWTSTPWATAGGWAHIDGKLKIDGAKAGTIGTFSRGTNVEFDATFTADAGQSGGLVLDHTGTANAVFSTEEGSGLWIYANGTRTQISSDLLGSSHRYKVSWGTSVITFSVDGAVVGTIGWSNTTAKRVTFSDATTGGSSLLVDNVAITPYAGNYSYTSRVLDARTTVSWSTATWNALVPAGTGVVVSVRTGNTVSPNSTWSAYKTVANGVPVGATSRYLQYRVVMNSNAPFNAASLQDITFNWGPYTPPETTTTTTIPGATTTMPPVTTTTTTTTTTTLPPSPAETETVVVSASATYGDDAVSLTASIVSSDEVDSGEAQFELLDGSNVLVGESVATVVSASAVSVEYDLPSGLSAGVYTIRVSYNGGGELANSTGTAVLTVLKAPLTIKADNKSMIYGGTMPGLTVSFDGFVNGDDVSSLTLFGGLSTNATSASPVGSYEISPPVVDVDDYVVRYLPGTLTISKAVLTVAVDDVSKVYGEVVPAFTTRFDGFLNGDGPSILRGEPTFSTDAMQESAVGAYRVDVDGLLAHDYEIQYVPGTLIVNPAALTITVNDATKVYGSPNPVFTASVSGALNGDEFDVPLFRTDAVDRSGVGAYTVVASGVHAPNYVITYVDGVLTVTKAPLTITAGSASKAYGASVPELFADVTGFVNGDDESVLPSLTVTTAATAASPVGRYGTSVHPVLVANYDITYIEGSIDVVPVPVVVKVADASKVYGSENPSFTAVIEGLVNGESENVLGVPVFDTVATTSSAVGSYAVTVGGLQSPNYEIAVVAGALDVTPAPLTIIADNKTKTYGSAVPAFTVSFEGFVNGDDPSVLHGVPVFETTADAASPVGSYSVDVDGVSASNYAITFVSGVLAVQPALLTIKADDKTREAGQPNPAFTVSISGLVNGDSMSVLSGAITYSTTATAASGAGSYPIDVSGVSSSNYSITFVAGTLTVTAPAVDDWRVNEVRKHMKDLDRLFKDAGGYTLTRQQLDCKTGASIGGPLLVQSRSAGGKLVENFDFKDATLGTCWRVELTLTKHGTKLKSPVFEIRKH